MFNISIDAVILHLGSFEVRWYLIAEIIAIAFLITFIILESRRRQIPLKHILGIMALVFFVGIILAKIVDIIGRPAYYISHPADMLSLAGMRAAGIMMSMFIVVPLYCWRTKLSFWVIGDVIAPGAAMATAIFRIGCLINGCCYGLESSIPWLSITYTGQNSLAPLNTPLYPVQLFKVIQGLIMFAVLWGLRKRLKPPGSSFLLLLIMFAPSDFIIRLFRQPDAVLMGIQIQQMVNAVLLLVAVPLFILRRWPKCEKSGLVSG